MEANVNQMKNSQTFSNFNSFQPQPQASFQPTWRPQQNVHQQPAFMVRFFFHVQTLDNSVLPTLTKKILIMKKLC